MYCSCANVDWDYQNRKWNQSSARETEREGDITIITATPGDNHFVTLPARLLLSLRHLGALTSSQRHLVSWPSVDLARPSPSCPSGFWRHPCEFWRTSKTRHTSNSCRRWWSRKMAKRSTIRRWGYFIISLQHIYQYFTSENITTRLT